MTLRSRYINRSLRAAAVMTLVVGSAIGLSASPASAVASNVFVACGYGDTVGASTMSGSGCTSLDTAITDAEALGTNSGYRATIAMMPGTYCPIDIPKAYDNLTFEGVGFAGVDTSGVVSYSGPEAALSTFKWSDASCGASAPAALVQASGGYDFEATLRFENLAIDGTGGPEDGMYLDGENLDLRDVLIENTSDFGLYYLSGEDTDSQISNSAFIGNSIGVEDLGESSIDESTAADNSTAGMVLQGDIHLDNDTISHNAIGVNVQGSGGNTIQVANTIVGDNTTHDCTGPILGDWESGGAGGGNGNNLIGLSCSVNASSDIALTDTIAETAANGGPTPSILPPSQAVGQAVAGYCGSTGSDQREYVSTSPGAACDIGSVDTTADGTTPDVSPAESPLAFGDIPTNQSGELSTSVSNIGGDLVGISGVSVTGSGFSLADNGDGCTYYLLIHVEASYCYVTVEAAPTGLGDISGTLAIQTSNGEVDVPLTATGAAPFGAPNGVQGTPGNKSVDLTWTPPTGDEPVSGYDIQYSTNDGASWTEGPSTNDPSAHVTGLSNGTSYVFEVAAIDSWGDGPFSSPSDPITPVAPKDHSALSAPHSVTINEGDKTTLTGALTDSTSHAAIAGASVSLLARAAGAGSFKPVGSPTTTNAQGDTTASIHPTVNTAYEWSYAGSGSHAAVTSSKATVLVAQVVHASLSKSKIKHGKSVEISGTVTPTEKGDVEVTTRYRPGNNKTTRIKLERVPNHPNVVRFSLKYTPPKKGTVTIDVSSAATSENAGGSSKLLKLKVT